MVRVPYVKLNSVHWRTHYVKFPWLNFQSTNLNWSMVSISRNPPGIHGAQVANISRRVNKVERLAHFLHPNMASMGTGFFWMTFFMKHRKNRIGNPAGFPQHPVEHDCTAKLRDFVLPPKAIPGPALGDVREECRNATGLPSEQQGWGECCPMTSESKFCPFGHVQNMSWKH